MGHPLFICESGTGRAIDTQKRKELDQYIRRRLQTPDWEPDSGIINRAGFTLSYHNGWLEVVVDSLSESDKEEVRDLVVFARTLGLNLFGDVGTPEDEMETEDIELWVGPLT